MNSLIIKLHQKLVLVFILVLLNVESVFAQQNNNDSSLITETVSSVSSNIEEGYRPSYNLDNDTQVNSFLKEFENSNALIYQKLDELANDDELLNSSTDNEIVYQEGYADNQTSNSNQVNTEISNLIEELANDKALSGNIIYDEKKPLENISQLEMINMLSDRYKEIPIVNNDNGVVGLLTIDDKDAITDIKSRKVCVLGLGYVGLPLSLVLAEKGLANLWIPKIILRVDEIPMLPTGKLDLKAIASLASSG